MIQTTPDPDALAAAAEIRAMIQTLALDLKLNGADHSLLSITQKIIPIDEAVKAALRTYGNARVSAARREGMEEAAKIADRYGDVAAAAIRAAIRAANTGGT